MKRGTCDWCRWKTAERAVERKGEGLRAELVKDRGMWQVKVGGGPGHRRLKMWFWKKPVRCECRGKG